MDDVSLIEPPAQAEDSEAGEAVESFIRMAARSAFTAVLFQEVESLCGKAYHPSPESEHQRAGSAPGRYFFGTDEEPVRRPRARKDGKEVRLKAYEAAQNRDAPHDAMLRAFKNRLMLASTRSPARRDLPFHCRRFAPASPSASPE